MARKKRYTAYLPTILVEPQLLERVRKYRRKSGKSIGRIVREALEEYLKKHRR